MMKHGDGVKDIAFQVEDCDFLVKVVFHASYIPVLAYSFVLIQTHMHTLYCTPKSDPVLRFQL